MHARFFFAYRFHTSETVAQKLVCSRRTVGSGERGAGAKNEWEKGESYEVLFSPDLLVFTLASILSPQKTESLEPDIKNSVCIRRMIASQINSCTVF